MDESLFEKKWYKAGYKLISMLVMYFFINSIFDWIWNFLYVISHPHRIMKGIRNRREFLEVRKNGTDDEKIKFLKKNYTYTSDGYKGFPDWKPRFIFVLAMKDFHDDCDGFGMYARWMFWDERKKEGNDLYAILPYKFKFWNRMHIVYYMKERNLVFSSGRVLQMDLEDYVRRGYTKNGIDALVIKAFYHKW